MKTCLKCGHINQDEAVDPLSACPKCGAIYARVEAARAPRPAPAVLQPVAPASRTFTSIHVGAAIALSLVVGYFAGREHVKWQMVSAISEAFGGVNKALSGAVTSKPAAKPAPVAAPVSSPEQKVMQPEPIGVTLISKGYRAADYSASPSLSEAIEFELAFRSNVDSDIRAFDGAVAFTDLLGNEILAIRAEINQSIPANGLLRWSGELDPNQFMESHDRLRAEPAENLKVRFITGKILFASGQTKTYND